MLDVLANYGLIGFLALVFPLVAFAYSINRRETRYREILDYYGRDRVWDVWYPEGGDEAKVKFARYLEQRVREHHGTFEFLTFSVLAAIATTLLAVVAARADLTDLGLSRTQVVAAFLGTYSGAILYLLRRYRIFDLRPATFLQTAVVLVAGTLGGTFLSRFFGDLENLAAGTAFLIGFLAATRIRFLPRVTRALFQRISQGMLARNRKEPDPDLSQMIDSPESIEALNRISIHSIRELANADPIRLYLSMPQQVGVINALIDEAILRASFRSQIDNLHAANIHRFTELLQRLKPKLRKDRIGWPDRVNVLDDGGKLDRNLLAAVRSIVHAGTHHWTLGLLLHSYREAMFRPDSWSPEPDEEQKVTWQGTFPEREVTLSSDDPSPEGDSGE